MSMIQTLQATAACLIVAVCGYCAEDQKSSVTETRQATDQKIVFALQERIGKGDQTARDELIALVKDERRTEKARETGIRALCQQKDPSNLQLLSSLLGSASDAVRVTAYFQLPAEIRRNLEFDFTIQPSPETLKSLHKRLDVEIAKFLAQPTKAPGTK